MLQARWDRDSAKWIGDLHKFAGLLVPGIRGAMDSTARKYTAIAQKRVPVFEGTLRDDLRVLRMGLRSGKSLCNFTIGFTNATVMPEIESVGKAKPFAIGWGKHDMGAKAHTVMLYNPRTGGSTAGRAKLIRYLKSKDSTKFGGLPDNADKEAVEKWRYETLKATGRHPKPWVMVDPQESATDFLWALIANDGDPLMGELVEQASDSTADATFKSMATVTASDDGSVLQLLRDERAELERQIMYNLTAAREADLPIHLLRVQNEPLQQRLGEVSKKIEQAVNDAAVGVAPDFRVKMDAIREASYGEQVEFLLQVFTNVEVLYDRIRFHSRNDDAAILEIERGYFAGGASKTIELQPITG